MRVVVVAMAYLGDTILTLPLIRLAREADGVEWVGVLTNPVGARFLRGQGGIDEVVVYDKRGEDAGTSGFLRTVGAVRRLRIDAALVVHRSFRSALLVLLAGVPTRIGFDESGSFFFTSRVRYRARPHELERAASLAEPLGVVVGEGQVPFSVEVPDGADAALDAVLERSGLAGRPLIVVAPGSQWPTKRWGAARFAETAARLAGELDAVPVLVGAATDRHAGKEVAGLLNGAVDLTGSLDLGPWIALIARSEVLLANDSAPGHVAAGVGTPVVAMFGPTVPEQGFAPYSGRARVLQADLDCRPCGRHGGVQCPLGTLDCMEGITVENAVAAALDLVGRTGREERGS